MKVRKNWANLNILLFPYLFVITVAFSIFETFTYSGLIHKYLFVSMDFVISLLIVSGILIVLSKKIISVNVPKILWLIFNLNSLMLPLTIIIYYIFIMNEISHYNNYVFSTYHIQPSNLMVTVFISGFVALISILINSKSSLKSKFKSNLKSDRLDDLTFLISRLQFKHTKIEIKPKAVVSIFMMVALLYFFVTNFNMSLNDISINSAYIFSHLNDSYDKKMEAKWGLYFKYLTFIKNNTPENSTILIPPQKSHWLSEGNSSLVRYFLYPRNLVHGDINSIPSDGYDYVMIASGLWEDKDVSYGWPKVKIEASELILWESSNNSVSSVNIDFDPNLFNFGKWGLIKKK